MTLKRKGASVPVSVPRGLLSLGAREAGEQDRPSCPKTALGAGTQSRNQKPQRRERPECARGWRRMAGPSPYPAAPLGTFTQTPQPGGHEVSHEAALPKSEDGNGRWGQV